MINFTSLPSLLLGVIYILANKRKNALIKNDYIEPSQNKQYHDFSLVISGCRKKQTYNRPY